MTPKYYEYLHSGYVPIMWPYRHVFRATPRCSEPRRAIPLYRAHGPRALSDTVHGIRRHRRACICTPDILIHSTIHTDYIIGLCRADRPSNCPSNGPVHVARSDAVYPIEITRFNMDDSGVHCRWNRTRCRHRPIRRGPRDAQRFEELPRRQQPTLLETGFFETLYVLFSFFFFLNTVRVWDDLHLAKIRRRGFLYQRNFVQCDKEFYFDLLIYLQICTVFWWDNVDSQMLLHPREKFLRTLKILQTDSVPVNALFYYINPNQRSKLENESNDVEPNYRGQL